MSETFQDDWVEDDHIEIALMDGPVFGVSIVAHENGRLSEVNVSPEVAVELGTALIRFGGEARLRRAGEED